MTDTDAKPDKPDSVIRKEIFDLLNDLHRRGHSRKDIVYYLREVADSTEDFWEGKDSYDMSPSEKDVVLPGDDHDDR